MIKNKVDLLIFAKQMEFYAVNRLRQEAKKMGLAYKVIRYEGMSLKLAEHKINFFYKGRSLPEAKMAIFRVAGRGGRGEHFVPQRTALLESWQDKPMVIMNLKTYLRFPRLNKLWQHYYLAKYDLPFVHSRNYASLDLLDPKKFKFPLIVKNRYGSGGQKVFKADSPLELRNLLAEDPVSVLIQPFLTTGCDYRVIVIGGKAIGAMKKTAPKGEFLTNVVRGGTATKVELTRELKTLAEKTARIFKADYAGVDIMYDQKGKPYILEINRGAQFEGFESSTAINVARKMIEYLLSRTP